MLTPDEQIQLQRLLKKQSEPADAVTQQDNAVDHEARQFFPEDRMIRPRPRMGGDNMTYTKPTYSAEDQAIMDQKKQQAMIEMQNAYRARSPYYQDPARISYQPPVQQTNPGFTPQSPERGGNFIAGSSTLTTSPQRSGDMITTTYKPPTNYWNDYLKQREQVTNPIKKKSTFFMDNYKRGF